MPRHLVTTVMATFALIVGGLVLATPADAEWSRPGQLTKYRICRAPANDGDAWRFVSKVRKYAATPDARAGIVVDAGSNTLARWSSGWLEKGEVEISRLRVKKSPKVRVTIWEEAGDLDSSTGTASQARVLVPKKIRHC